MQMHPPVRYIVAALWQWCLVGVVYGTAVLLTYFPIGLIVAATARPGKSPFNEGITEHSQKYIDQGSSGFWEYWISPLKWTRGWNNYEDGLLGEPSGKHSARVKGKERSFLAIYGWVCRNPYNWGKRTNRFFACFVNDCEIEWWGTGDVSDKGPIVPGWYFIRATDRLSGRVYYGYRYVIGNRENIGWRKATAVMANSIRNLFSREKRDVNDTVYNAVFGFKIKPSHAFEVQGKDDLDKAFTARIQFASQPD